MIEDKSPFNKSFLVQRDFAEMTAAAVVAPDEIQAGRFYMIISSDVVQVTMSHTGPSAEYKRSSEPITQTPFLILAYCFPFASVAPIGGSWASGGTKQIVDVRQHRLAEISKRFVASLFPSGSDSRRKLYKRPEGRGSDYRTATPTYIKAMNRRRRSDPWRKYEKL